MWRAKTDFDTRSQPAQTRRRARMPLRRPYAETLRKPIEKLRGQGNFRQQDQSLAAARQPRRQGGEIGLGFSRPGNAIEHGDAKSAGCDTVQEALRRGRLVGGQHRTGPVAPLT